MAFIHATFRNVRTDTTHTVYTQTPYLALCMADIETALRKIARDFPTAAMDEFRLIALEYKGT
jgi:hypothetical protein